MTPYDEQPLDDDPTVIRRRVPTTGADEQTWEEDHTVVRRRVTELDVDDDDPTVIRPRSNPTSVAADLVPDDDPTVIRARTVSGPEAVGTLDDDPTVVRKHKGLVTEGSVDDDPTVVTRNAHRGPTNVDDDPTAIRARVDVPDEDVTVVSGKRAGTAPQMPVTETTVPRSVARVASSPVHDDTAIVSIPVDPSSPLSYERYELRKTAEPERAVRQNFTQTVARQRVAVPETEKAPSRRKPKTRWGLIVVVAIVSCTVIVALSLWAS